MAGGARRRDSGELSVVLPHVQNSDGTPIAQGTGEGQWRAHRAKSEVMLDNRIGYAGYIWDPWLKVYHVRHRVYMPGTAGAAAPTALTTVTGGTAIGSLSGGASNIVSQKTQFDQGYRTSFDATEFATETAFGGVFGGVFNGVLNAARVLGAGTRPTVTGVLNGQRTGAAAAGGAAVTECGASAGAGTEKAALQKLVTAAEGRFAKEGLTIRQEFRATLNPKLEPAFRGERMDHFFRQAFEADPVPGLELTPRGVFGPDVRSLSGRHWYDLTTPQAWNAHLRKYSPRFGTDGRPLHYNP